MIRTRVSTATGPPKPPLGVVLVVEDDPSVRSLLRRMLQAHNLAVVPVETPDEAIDVSRSNDDPINVMVTDLQLPGMSGVELARRVRGLRPKLPIVFVSGYTRDTAFGDALEEFADDEFLQKPFTPSQLAEVVLRSMGPPPGDTIKIPMPETPPPK